MKFEIIKKTKSEFSFNLIHLSSSPNPKRIFFIFPGAGYSYMGPLFYYPTQWMLEKGNAIIIADYDFRFFSKSNNLSEDEVLKFCTEELLFFAKSKYKSTVTRYFLGKSTGTRALTMLEVEPQNSKIVWLTPVWKRKDSLKSMIETKYQSLFIVGDRDPHYSVEAVNSISKNPKCKILVFPKADHSLDIDESLIETMKTHQMIFSNIFNFFEAQ